MRSDLIRSTTRRLLGAAAVVALAAGLQASPAAASGAVPSPDELKALIYFLQQGDDHAANAETGRLRTIYPAWVPPVDLASLGQEPSGDEIDAIFRRIAAGEFDAAEAAITSLRVSFPSWSAPTEMTDLIQLGEAQLEFDQAIAGNDIVGAAVALRRAPALRGCDRVNNVWRLADLQAEGGDKRAALQTHAGVIGACDDVDIVAASLEKSASVATPEELRDLATTAKRRFPNDENAIGALEERLLAGMGVSTPKVAQKPAAPSTAADAEATADVAERPAAKPKTQRRAASKTPGRLPLTGDRRLKSVRQAAAEFDWSECLKRSSKPRSVDVLYQRSWCNMNMERPIEALVGFREVAERVKDPVVRRDAAYGAALAYLARGLTNEAAVIAASTDFTLDQRRGVEARILDQRAVLAFDNGEYLHAVAYLDALENLTGGMRHDLDMLRGWAMLRGGRRVEAYDHFRRLHEEIRTQDTRNALNAAATPLE